jgi:hypothetical protein
MQVLETDKIPSKSFGVREHIAEGAILRQTMTPSSKSLKVKD